MKITKFILAMDQSSPIDKKWRDESTHNILDSIATSSSESKASTASDVSMEKGQDEESCIPEWGTEQPGMITSPYVDQTYYPDLSHIDVSKICYKN